MVQAPRKAAFGRASGKIRHQVQLERWPRAWNLFLGVSARALPLPRVPRAEECGCRTAAPLIRSPIKNALSFRMALAMRNLFLLGACRKVDPSCLRFARRRDDNPLN